MGLAAVARTAFEAEALHTLLKPAPARRAAPTQSVGLRAEDPAALNPTE